MALWERRTKFHSPSYPYQYENKNNIMKWFDMYVDCAQGLSPTAWCLTEVKLLLYRYATMLLYKFTLYGITK